LKEELYLWEKTRSVRKGQEGETVFRGKALDAEEAS